jgi:hypothetical protein
MGSTTTRRDGPGSEPVGAKRGLSQSTVMNGPSRNELAEAKEAMSRPVRAVLAAQLRAANQGLI